jgi:predicted TIM-barrel fold metal-dependent hydrolase
MAALVFDNPFGRFPNLMVATIECGSGWVQSLLPKLDKAQMSCTTHSPWIGGRLKERASDVFKGHVRVNPFPEEDHVRLFKLLGPERLLFGSDWPHPEGITEPGKYPEFLPAGTTPETIQRIMRGNARALLGLPG